MLSAAAIAAGGLGGWIARVAVALCLALALVLDTADGRLARLAGNELGLRPMARPGPRRAGRHGAPRRDRLGRLRRDGRPVWLLLGIIYASAKVPVSWFSRCWAMSWKASSGVGTRTAPVCSDAVGRESARVATGRDRLAGSCG